MKLTQFEMSTGIRSCQMASDSVKEPMKSSSYFECEDCHITIQRWTAFKEHLYLKSHMLGHYRFRRTKTGDLEPDPMWTGAAEEVLYQRCSRIPEKKIMNTRQRQEQGNMRVIGTTGRYIILEPVGFASQMLLAKQTDVQEKTHFFIRKPKRRTSFLFWNQSDFIEKPNKKIAKPCSDIELKNEMSVRNQVEMFRRGVRVGSPPSKQSGFTFPKRCHNGCKNISTGEGDIDPSNRYWYCS